MNQQTSSVRGNGEQGEMLTVSPSIQHHWPSLGRELMAREQRFVSPSATDQHAQATRERLRQETLSQVYQAEGQYSRVTRYLAFLLVKYGRGAEIVGNPVFIKTDGTCSLLPYTGLEGYYAGSVQTALFSGLSPYDVLCEEARKGVQMVKALKKDAVEHDSWAAYAHLRHTLEGKEQRREAIGALRTIWMMLISQMRGRVYHHAEFEQALIERIEQGEHILGQITDLSEEGLLLKQTLQKEQDRLNAIYASLSEEEKNLERSEQRRREAVRRERVAAFQHFREETYRILEESQQERYEVDIQDSSWDKATFIETIVLPRIPARETYPVTQVHFTPEELDGYLFLARLGEIGADPLARSKLLS